MAHPSPVLLTWGTSPNVPLPSFDPICLAVEAYLRFAHKDFTINPCNLPRVAPTGELPVLIDGPEVVAGSDAILTHMRKLGYNLDYKLTPKQKADARAFCVLVEEDLHLALLRCWWVEEDNAAVIQRMYYRAMPFPWNWIVPRQLKADAEARTSHFKAQGPTEYTHEAYLKAREIYSHLATKLGNQRYFFGSEPTTLDAVVYGHLAVHYHVPLPTARLRAILASFPTLVAFLGRVREDFFWRWKPTETHMPASLPRSVRRAPRSTPTSTPPQPAAASSSSSSSSSKTSGSKSASTKQDDKPPSSEEVVMARRRNAFVAAAAAAVIGYSYHFQPWRAVLPTFFGRD